MGSIILSLGRLEKHIRGSTISGYPVCLLGGVGTGDCASASSTLAPNPVQGITY